MAADPYGFPPRLRCSYRIATLVVCSCNIVAAIYVLHSFLAPLFFTPSPSPSSFASTHGHSHGHGPSPLHAVKYTQEQLNRMKEAVAIWKGAEPVELINRVKEIQEESAGAYGFKDVGVAKKPGALGLVQRLKELRDSNSKSDQEALEEWRRKKLEEARRRSEAMKANLEEYSK